MIPIEKRLNRLADVARMYYEKEMTQSEIAASLHISRPMVSKLLAEARELGVVTITIHQLEDAQLMLARQLKERFGLKAAVVVKTCKEPGDTNLMIVAEAMELCAQLNTVRQKIGLGWGSMLGKLTDYIEQAEQVPQLLGDVLPLIGGVRASYRSYHTNELVRIFADKTGLNPAYLYIPAIVDSEEEKLMYENTETFKDICNNWSQLNTAVINISNYPSSPDMATAYRFGDRLNTGKATGSILAHYYNREGEFIEPEANNVMQISVVQLRSVQNVVAVCNCILRVESLIGALHSGIPTHMVIGDELAVQLLQS